MQLVVVGINHKTAPLHLRERLALPGPQAPEMATRLLGSVAGNAVGGPAPSGASQTEAMVVSTCNRVECYIAAPTACVAQRQVIETLAAHANFEPAELTPHLYVHEQGAALRHIFRVVSSLDSMVVGEPQIAGQIKQAYQQAVDAKSVGSLLHRVMHEAFRVSKRVRAETGIGEHAVSMSFLAVELARQILGKLTGKRALLIGAGKMSTLAARHLHHHGISELLIVNRSPAKAEALAAELGGRACPTERLHDLLVEVDIVIASTNAPGFVLHHEAMARTMKARRGRPLFLIDLAVPRDIEPTIHQIENTFLYDVDDMQQVLRDNLQARQREAAHAERLVEEEVLLFARRLQQGEVVPTIVALREHHLGVAQREMAQFLRKHPDLSDAQRQDIERLLDGVVSKLMHAPSVALKRAAGTPESDRLVSATRALFDLPRDPAPVAAENPLPAQAVSEVSKAARA